MDWRRLLEIVKKIAEGQSPMEEKLKAICELLARRVSHYDWVGFYLADGEKKELLLGPFIGEPTEHTRINFGEGICGRVAETKDTLIVQDVSGETNYISCNAAVKSEIVVPIFKNGDLIGELDIDSHSFSPFSKDDVEFLEQVCEIVSRFL